MRVYKIVCDELNPCLLAVLLNRTTLQMFVDDVRGSKKIPRAMIENLAQFCFQKPHSEGHSRPSMLHVFPKVAVWLTREVV